MKAKQGKFLQLISYCHPKIYIQRVCYNVQNKEHIFPPFLEEKHELKSSEI